MSEIKSCLQILLIILLSTAFGCNSSGDKQGTVEKKSSVQTNNNYNTYFPLKDGNKWIYVSDGPTNEIEMFTVEASGVKKVEDGIQLKVSSFPYFTKESKERTLIIKHNGEIIASDIFGSSGTVFPAPENFKEGFEWKFGILNGFITSDTSNVETWTRNFENCIKLNMTDGFTFAFEMWFKKDVGIVKWGANRTNPPVLKGVYYILKDYRLN